MNKKLIFYTVALTAGLLTACSSDDEQKQEPPVRHISVEVNQRPMTSDDPAGARSTDTRSAITTTETFSAFSMRGIYNSLTTNYTVSKSGGIWTVAPDTWPGGSENNNTTPFYAYTDGTFYSNNGTPFIDFTIAENASTQWMSALKTIADKPQHAPYFMLTPEWDKKSLNAMLGSWTELKHDAILYAKQPMGAECGGAGPPDPIVKGYVEPNIQFWQKAIDLLKENKKILTTHDLLTEKIANANQQLIEQAEFLLAMSKKELKGEVLKDVEYDQLEYIGAKFENMSLDLLRDSEHEFWSWEAIQGPDRKVALVADVYTANADNNPDKSILYEAIGDADEIYVVVEIGGYLWLTRGAVFSYREFDRPIDEQRMNDEEWQQYLEHHPRWGVPEWMNPIIVPLNQAPIDNESVFYSSGC